MRKKGRIKYIFMIFLCFLIFIYGFIEVNINKPELVRKKSKFTMELSLVPIDFKIETVGYVFYANSKIIDSMKDKCVNAYNKIISK
ncbi:hypothetical protein K9O30_10780 [Clostridium bowmanii]|uniref:hypothetical protein n=1 Tax=Clostridium bowmanii TaxID=132925 RepID=UPI001C0AC257|nr:hypothetical protein [Clostridium bowmanii]MBU3189714.1 hypothetical protein [Clostridium bowmanii]MCA1074196.1 hypothetical protein [Clostridium bowmanii]